MRSIQEILAALEQAKGEQDYAACVAICHEGIATCRDPKESSWYALRLYLANLLLQNGENVASADQIEEAVNLYLEILANLPQDEHFAKNQADTLMGLGWAYYLRIRGDTQDNLIKAINAFSAALAYYNNHQDHYSWACVRAAMGLVYSCILDDDNSTRIQDAINCYEDAIQVFDSVNYPEEWKEIRNRLEELKLRKTKREVNGNDVRKVK